MTAMPLAESKSASHLDLKIIVAILAVSVSLFHLGLASSGRGIRRDQHLGTALEYATGRIDLLHPIILGMTANGAPTPLEFPVWQAATGALMKLFGRWYGWGNIVSLLFHLSTLWPLFQLGERMFSRRVAWWSLAFYLAQPLTFLWGGIASADGMAGSLAIWFVWFCWRMLSTDAWSWWPATAFVGCLSATTKAPFFFVAGLTVFFWLLGESERRRSRTAWLQLISAGTASVLAFVLWNHHANNCYSAAEFPCYDLRIGTGTSIMTWWFGDFATRLNAKSWIRGAWRAATNLLGSLGWIVLPMAGWFLRGSGPLRLWIAAAMGALLIFTNLILIHWHYYYIFAVPVALLAARAAVEFEPALWRVFPPGISSRVFVCVTLAAVSLAQGLQAAHLNLLLDRYPEECGHIIKVQTGPTDKLVVWGGGWTTPLLQAERQGVSVLNFDAIQNSNKCLRLKELGYNKLVLMNTSPLLVAINQASGMGGFELKHLPDELPAVARNWKVVFESPSLLILEIPQ
jgi:hypothetical protein